VNTQQVASRVVLSSVQLVKLYSSSNLIRLLLKAITVTDVLKFDSSIFTFLLSILGVLCEIKVRGGGFRLRCVDGKTPHLEIY
jgi:hypothetical protein